MFLGWGRRRCRPWQSLVDFCSMTSVYEAWQWKRDAEFAVLFFGVSGPKFTKFGTVYRTLRCFRFNRLGLCRVLFCSQYIHCFSVFTVKSPSSCEIVEKRSKQGAFGTPILILDMYFQIWFTSEHICAKFGSVSFGDLRNQQF